jgi:hypothetical protein
LSGTEQDVLQSIAHAFRLQRLRAHCGVGVESCDDCVHELGFEIRRVGELFFGVVRRLLLERFGFEQLTPQDKLVYVNNVIKGKRSPSNSSFTFLMISSRKAFCFSCTLPLPASVIG